MGFRDWMVAAAVIGIGCGDDGGGDATASTSSGGSTGDPTSASAAGSEPTTDDPGTTSPTSSSSATTNTSTSTASTASTATSSTGSSEETGPPAGDPGGSLRFYGNGGLYDDRVLIPLDDPSTDEPGPPLDVGNEDFTIEFWIRPDPKGNPNPAINCGANNDWTTSNIIVDRDRHSQPPSYGVGIAGGVIVWAVQGDFLESWSICGTTDVLDDAWHHIAVQRRRSDGMLWIYVDGQLDAMQDGADGDISYPDDGVPMDVCPAGLCDYSDPYLSLGAEKHGYESISYAGLFDELRVSTVLRYEADFTPTSAAFAADADTVGLYHFDEGRGGIANDASQYGTHGEIRYGGTPPGPDWDDGNPF